MKKSEKKFARSQRAHLRLARSHSRAGSPNLKQDYHSQVYFLQESRGSVLPETERRAMYSKIAFFHKK